MAITGDASMIRLQSLLVVVCATLNVIFGLDANQASVGNAKGSATQASKAIAPDAQFPASYEKCDAPVYFGICDPFVPGTVIGGMFPDKSFKSIKVATTWHDGPAEKAGVCPGDEIIAVDGMLVPGHTKDQMLREIVSPSPSRIALEVVHGKQQLDLQFERVRESRLAQLSHQRFARRRMLLMGLQATLVPAEETPEELEAMTRFYDGVDGRVGFRVVGGMDVPEGNPEEQVRNLEATIFEGHQHERRVGETGISLNDNSYTPGFSAVLLQNPEQVLIGTILPGSPAQKSGLFSGDQILDINGYSVSGLDARKIQDLILKPDGQQDIALKIRRRPSTLTLKVGTRIMKEISDEWPYRRVSGEANPMKAETLLLGIAVLYAGKPTEAMVEQVQYPSPAFDAGLHVGDRVLAVNGVPIEQITAAQQLQEMLQPKANSKVKVEVARLGQKLQFQIQPATFGQVEATIGRKIGKLRAVPQQCPES
jgi:C-terminal processing protease CtpA/Prc